MIGAGVRSLGAVGQQQQPGLGGGSPSELTEVAVAVVDREAGRREGVVAAAPPAFHDLVKRSTRFMTSGDGFGCGAGAGCERVSFYFRSSTSAGLCCFPKRAHQPSTRAHGVFLTLG